MIKLNNFNNPEDLALSNSYSTVSVTLDNPILDNTINYGDFRTANPIMQSMLPKNLNLGITSPGFVDMETNCTGLDYMNTNPDYDKLPFMVCLNKFQQEYQIPEMAFNNLLKNLPYTFSALTEEEKRRYLASLENFLKKEKSKSTGNTTEKFDITDNFKSTENFRSTENFGKNKPSSSNYLTWLMYIGIAIVFLVCIILITKIN